MVASGTRLAPPVSPSLSPECLHNGGESCRLECTAVSRIPALRGSLEVFDSAHPAGQWVPSGENLGHHLQVIDSKRFRSSTHSVDRTAVPMSWRGASVVQRSPEPLQTLSYAEARSVSAAFRT